MEVVEGLAEQEQVFAEQRELSGTIEDIRGDVKFLGKRLDRLAKLQSLIKEKYRKKLEALFDQLNSVDKQQCELKSYVKQLKKKNKERRSILKKRIAGLERRKKTIREAIKQIAGYEKSSGEQVETIEEEQEVLYQRTQDLMEMLGLAEQAELNGRELDIVCQRVCATKGLLEEHEIDLRKRTIDLLFEFYTPPKNSLKAKLKYL